MPISRRAFLYSTPLTLSPLVPRSCAPILDGHVNESSPFLHGVASGDPLPDAVVLWTRVTGDSQPPEHFAVGWAIAKDAQFKKIVAEGIVGTDESVDHTVKVDVGGLDAGKTYYYRFHALGFDSAIGRTRTPLKKGTERLRFAVVSCSNLPYGYFNAYAALAKRADLDAVLHLGDYLYEYGNGTFGDGTALGRVPSPDREILSLADYRARHAQYKTDPDLQEAHRQHPFIAVWDDHETSNDAWEHGAENHQPDEGDFEVRKAAALQAYFEWMPVRTTERTEDGKIYRSFRFGELADLVMLDTRLIGRDQQVSDACDTGAIGDPDRQLLGEAQEQWFFRELKRSKQRSTRWRLVGQQVMFGQLINVLAAPGNCIFNPDQWDGYAAARARVLTSLAQNGIDNVVILTGDIHSSWGNDITANPFDPSSYTRETGAGSVAVEFVAPAVTSPGIDDPVLAVQFAAALRATHPHIKFVELYKRGYALLDVTRDRVQAEWYHLATITERSTTEALGGSLQTLSGANHLTPATEPSAPRADAPPLAPQSGTVA